MPSKTMSTFTVIAHRGASGYLPEHTREAAALAHGMGADYIELDVVITSDDVPIVLHDLWLDAVTNVAERFPGRHRNDGRHYAIDFTWQEIQTLWAHERVLDDGSPAFPGRFSPEVALFRVPGMEEMIRLIQGLNQTTGREAGIYIEPKAPAFHHAAGKDSMATVIRTLAAHGLSRREDKVLLQSFNFADLRRARLELRTEFQLVQLIGENDDGESDTDFDYLRTDAGLAEIATFAEGIGPSLHQVLSLGEDGLPIVSGLVDAAHRHKLFVHGYTLRADRLPGPLTDFNAVVRLLAGDVHLDGVFTDQPDRVRAALPSPG